MRPRSRWMAAGDAFPTVMRYGGLLGVAFCAVVWLFTDRIEPLLLSAFGTMMGIGEVTGAIKDLAAGRQPPPASPPSETGTSPQWM